MTNRTFLRNLHITAPHAYPASVLLDACDEQFFTGCLITDIEILIGEDCKKGCFNACHIIRCVIRMHPRGPGRKAFSECIFDDTTRWES